MKKLSTRASRLVYAICQDEARKNGSKEVLPEHIMLALIKSGDGLGFETLKFLRLNVLTYQLALEDFLNSSSDHVVMDADEIPQNRRVQTLLDIAEIESTSLMNPYVGTEHILLAAIREANSLTSSYFESAAIPISKVREAVRNVQQSNDSSYYDKVSKDLAAQAIQNIFGKDSLGEFASFLKTPVAGKNSESPNSGNQAEKKIR